MTRTSTCSVDCSRMMAILNRRSVFKLNGSCAIESISRPHAIGRSSSERSVQSVIRNGMYWNVSTIWTGWPSIVSKFVRSTSCRRRISFNARSSAARSRCPLSRKTWGRL